MAFKDVAFKCVRAIIQVLFIHVGLV